MSPDHDRFFPSGHQPGNVLANDGLPEDGAAEHVPDGAVRALPHFLELELFDPLLVGRDRGALDADVVLLDGFGAVQRHLVVGQVAVFHAQVVNVKLDVQERQDEFLLDQVPDNAGHLVAQDVDHGPGADFRHV